VSSIGPRCGQQDLNSQSFRLLLCVHNSGKIITYYNHSDFPILLYMLFFKLGYSALFHKQTTVIDLKFIVILSRNTLIHRIKQFSNFFVQDYCSKNISIICSDGPVAQSYKRGPSFIAIMSSLFLVLYLSLYDSTTNNKPLFIVGR
jgi:hypothetical protein